MLNRLALVVALALISTACEGDGGDSSSSGAEEMAGDGDGDGEPLAYCCDCSDKSVDWCTPTDAAECEGELKWCDRPVECSAQCDMDPINVCCTCHADGLVCDISWPTDRCHEIGLEVFADCTYDWKTTELECPQVCDEPGDGDGDG